MESSDTFAIGDHIKEEVKIPTKLYCGTSIYNERQWLLDSETQLGLGAVFAAVLFRDQNATVFIQEGWWFSTTTINAVASFDLREPNSIDDLVGTCKRLKRRFWFRRISSPYLLVACYKQTK